MMPPLPGDVQWFPAEIRRLIQAIRKHEGIYNPRHEEFGLREFQGKAWKVVATLVGGGKTDTQCRDKWNCLRGTYRRHVRTEATNNVKRRSGWPWADMMSFIKKYVVDKDELAELRQSQIEKGPKKHKPNCPASQNNKHVNKVTVSTANVPNNPPGLTFSGGILSGGIIFNTNRVGIGIVQPNQSNVGIGIVQPSKSNVVPSNQPDNVPSSVALNVVQPIQTNMGVRMVHTNQSNLIVRNIEQSNLGIAVTKPSVTNTAASDPIHVDLSRIKNDVDASKSPARTEFVDIDVMVKKEPIEEDEVELSEVNFLSEEGSQDSVQSNNTTAKVNGTLTPDEGDSDSNLLFMRSTVAHMRQLSAYDQSVFKLKVQQLLHDMMFPTEKHN